MRPSVQLSIARSTNAFQALVWPRIEDWFGGGQLLPIEGDADNDIKRTLDMQAGIDAFHVAMNGSTRAIASRCQVCDGSFSTFTIRTRTRGGSTNTELSKRMRALFLEDDRGWLYPHVTVQAYLASWKGPLNAVAAIRTRDLFAYVREHENDRRRVYRQSNDDPSEFYAISWQYLVDDGVYIKRWPIF
jgi:hypothetical protein